MKPLRLAAAAMLSILLVAPSFAANAMPLPAGKPTGTRDAAFLASLGLPVIAITGFAALAALLATTVGKGDSPSTTGTAS